MKWLTGIWQIVASLSLRAKTIFCFCVLFIVGGYFFLDRYLTYNIRMARVQSRAMNHKKMVEKTPINTDVPYKDRTLFLNKAQETK